MWILEERSLNGTWRKIPNSDTWETGEDAAIELGRYEQASLKKREDFRVRRAGTNQTYRDNPDGGLGAFGTGVLVLAAVGITYLMFREKPGKEPAPPAPPPAPPPPPAPVFTPPPIVVVTPPTPTVCTINLKRFNAWLASKDGFKGVWLDNVQTTPPILSVLRTDHPALVGTPWSKTVVATNGGEKIWRYHEDGEPFTEPGFRDEYCAWQPTLCVVTEQKFESWALSVGKIGVWWPDVTTAPPNAAAVKASVPDPKFTQLQTVQPQNIAVATDNGGKIWYFDVAGEPFSSPKIHQQLCSWIAANP